jgi:hypothetical protein
MSTLSTAQPAPVEAEAPMGEPSFLMETLLQLAQPLEDSGLKERKAPEEEPAPLKEPAPMPQHEEALNDFPEASGTTLLAMTCPIQAQQRIMSTYSRLYTPYRGLLLMHQLGPGYAAVAVALAEGLKEPSKPVLVLLFQEADLSTMQTNLIACGTEFLVKNHHWMRHVWTDPGVEKQMLMWLGGKEANLAHLKRDNPQGAYLLKAGLPPNAQTFLPKRRQMLDTQIRHMLAAKFRLVNAAFFDYPSMTSDSSSSVGFLDKELPALSKRQQNPFNDHVVVVDDVQFLADYMTNTSRYMVPAQAFAKASNCKLLFLLGNRVDGLKLAWLFNMLRGAILSWYFPIKAQPNDATKSATMDDAKIKAVFKKMPGYSFDPVKQLVKVTRNALNYRSTSPNAAGGIDDDDRISANDYPHHITQKLATHGIEVELYSKMEAHTLFPEQWGPFTDEYVSTVNSVEQISNPVQFKRLIAGLVAVLPEKQLLPSLLPLRILKVPLSETQQALQKNPMPKPANSFNEFLVVERLACDFPLSETSEAAKQALAAKRAAAKETGDGDEDEGIAEDLPDSEFRKTMQQAVAAVPVAHLGRDELHLYSPKYAYLLRKLLKKDSGKHLVFSQFAVGGGLGMLERILAANGFVKLALTAAHTEAAAAAAAEPLLVDLHGMSVKKWLKKPKYLLLSSSKDDDGVLTNIFNGQWAAVSPAIRQQLGIKKGHYVTETTDPDFNREMLRHMRQDVALGQAYGKVGLLAPPIKADLKKLLVTSSRSLNLKNVRSVHLVEPVWELQTLQDVLAHVRFLCCHADLPPEQQVIQPYLYLSTAGSTLAAAATAKEPTIEEVLHKFYLKKDQQQNVWHEIIKQAAVECALNGKHCFVTSGSTKKDDPLALAKAKVRADALIERMLQDEERGHATGASASEAAAAAEASANKEPRDDLVAHQNAQGDTLYLDTTTGTWYGDAAGQFPVMNAVKHFLLCNKVRQFYLEVVTPPRTLELQLPTEVVPGKAPIEASAEMTTEEPTTEEPTMTTTSEPEPWLDLQQTLDEAKLRLDAQQLSETDKTAVCELTDVYHTVSTEQPALQPCNVAFYELVAELQLISASPQPMVFFNWMSDPTFLETIKLYTSGAFKWCGGRKMYGAKGTKGAEGEEGADSAADAEKWLPAKTTQEPGATAEPTLTDLMAHVHQSFAFGCTLYCANEPYVSDVDLFRQFYEGLRTLADGGHLVVHQLYIVTPFQRSLLALVAYFFHELQLCKPLASNPVLTNVFVVGRSFLKSRLTPQIEDQLEQVWASLLKAQERANKDETLAHLLTPLLKAAALEADADVLAAANFLYGQQQILYMTLGITLFKTDQMAAAPLRDYYEKQAKYWLARYY